MPAATPSRPPLDGGRLAATGPWQFEVSDEAGSTNAAAAARFRAGQPPGLALVTEHQTAGRGRLDRSWVTPPRSSLTVSFLIVPEGVPVGRWPWLPLLAGVAVVAAVRRCCPSLAVEPTLKWPNDVVCSDDAGDRKLAGILLERVEEAGRSAAVVGIGLNVSQAADELPVPSGSSRATSLVLEGAGEDPDRTGILLALGDELASRVVAWTAVGGEPAQLRSSYLSLCGTLGRQVRVELPGQEVVAGRAVDVDGDGRLVVRGPQGELRVGAGDVVHVRPGPDRA